MTKKSPSISRRTAVIASVAAIGVHGLLFGQSALKIPSFEVASVKANLISDPSDPRYTGLTDYVPQRSGDRISMRNSQLRSILAWAYDLTNPGYQLVAGRWGKTVWEDSYDIEALATGSPGDDDLRRMFQTLLEDRFKLIFHRETRELPAYDLVVAHVAFSSGIDASEAPVLTTAILELGLNLKKVKGKFAVLVIDQLAKPSEN